MVENVKFKAKYDEAKDEIIKLRTKFKNRIEKLEKTRIDTAIENIRYDVKNIRYDAEFKVRIAKLEKNFKHP